MHICDARNLYLVLLKSYNNALIVQNTLMVELFVSREFFEGVLRLALNYNYIAVTF